MPARSTRSAATARSIVAALDAALHEAGAQAGREAASGQGSLFGDPPTAPTKPARTQLARSLANIPPWTEQRAAREGEGDPRLLHLRPSARAVPHRVRAVRHAHRRASSARGASDADDPRRRRHGDQEADQQAQRRRVRAVDSGGFFGIFRSARLPRGLGDSSATAIQADIPVLLKGGYSKRDQGVREPDLHRRDGHAASRSCARRARWRSRSSSPLGAPVAADVHARRARRRRGARRDRRRSSCGGATGTARSARLRSRSLKIVGRRTPRSHELRAPLLGDERVRLVTRELTHGSTSVMEFEKPIAELEKQIDELKRLGRRQRQLNMDDEIAPLEREARRAARGRSTTNLTPAPARAGRAQRAPPVHARLHPARLHRLHRAARRPRRSATTRRSSAAGRASTARR